MKELKADRRFIEFKNSTQMTNMTVDSIVSILNYN